MVHDWNRFRPKKQKLISKKLKKVRIYRIFSEEFERQMFSEYESKEYSISELSRIYNISVTSLNKWVYQYSSYLKSKQKL